MLKHRGQEYWGIATCNGQVGVADIPNLNTITRVQLPSVLPGMYLLLQEN